MAESSEIYAAQLAAVQAQNARIYGPPSTGNPWGGASARQFRFDPLRVMDGNLAVIASYVRADDVLVDVGGGVFRWPGTAERLSTLSRRLEWGQSSSRQPTKQGEL